MSTLTGQEKARILRDAAAELERNGWCQDELYDGQSACALGALYRVTGIKRSGDRWRLVDWAGAALEPIIRMREITDWNDQPGRTQEDVVKAFLQAADLAEVSS